MINPLHIVVILSLLAGWHLDAIDHALIERHRARLAPLNQATEPPVIIDIDDQGQPVIRRGS